MRHPRVNVGTVDRVEDSRIKLIKTTAAKVPHEGHHHFIDLSLVIEGDNVRLAANADVAVTFEEKADGSNT